MMKGITEPIINDDRVISTGFLESLGFRKGDMSRCGAPKEIVVQPMSPFRLIPFYKIDINHEN